MKACAINVKPDHLTQIMASALSDFFFKLRSLLFCDLGHTI